MRKKSIFIICGIAVIGFGIIIFKINHEEERQEPVSAVPDKPAAPIVSPSPVISITENERDKKVLDIGWDVSLENLVEDKLTEQQRESLKDAIIAGMGATTEEAIKIYEDYLKKYPLEAGAIPMMSRLGFMYSRAGRYEDARQMLEDAIEQAGDDRFINVLKINLGSIEMAEEHYDKAEEYFGSVENLPVSYEHVNDPYEVAPQLFMALRGLAKVKEKRGDIESAHEYFAQIAERATDLSNQYPDLKWSVKSYFVSSYASRVYLIHRTEPENIERAKALCSELEEYLPYFDEHARICYGDMKGEIMRWEIDLNSSQ